MSLHTMPVSFARAAFVQETLVAGSLARRDHSRAQKSRADLEAFRKSRQYRLAAAAGRLIERPN